jgi:hypothetical protein
LRVPVALLCLLAACAAAKPEPEHASNAPTDAGPIPADVPIAGDAATAAATRPEADAGANTHAAASADDAADASPKETIADEPAYLPGRRMRAKGGVSASSDDEVIARWNRGSTADSFHPAPRITVDVSRTQGMRPAEILKVARSKGYWPIRLCYEQGLRKAQRLHGSLSLALDIAPGGAVKGARRLKSDIEDKEVAACVARSLGKLVLASPTRKTGRATLTISLWPGDEPAYVAGSPDPDGRTSPAVPAEIAASLRVLWPQFRSCYREGLERDKALWGRIALKLRISPKGDVMDASQVESRFPDPGVTECIVGASRSASFPASGKEVIVVYPLRLGSPPEEQPPP